MPKRWPASSLTFPIKVRRSQTTDKSSRWTSRPETITSATPGPNPGPETFKTVKGNPKVMCHAEGGSVTATFRVVSSAPAPRDHLGMDSQVEPSRGECASPTPAMHISLQATSANIGTGDHGTGRDVRVEHLGHQPAAVSTEGHAMLKAIKGNALRKPPELATDHSDIDDWLRHQMPHLQPIVKRLDETIRATIPGLHYAVKWKRPYYGLPELGCIIELAAYDVSVNVVFLGGADFDCPPPLGITDRTRYVKVTTADEVQRPELRKWIKEASRTLGWK